MNPHEFVLKPHGYGFVLTPIDLTGGVGTELAPGYRIQKATPEQVAQIKKMLARFNANFDFNSPYEHDVRYARGDKPGPDVYDLLPPERWRYWVVVFEGTGNEVGDLGLACAIAAQDLELAFCVVFIDKSIMDPMGSWSYPFSLTNFFYSDYRWTHPKVVCEQDLLQIRHNFDHIKKLSPQHPHIERAIIRFKQLSSLPRESEMRIIGLFSVIESLITHGPKLKDHADSLSHQLQTKIPLLGRRFQLDLDHTKHFSGITETALWEKLYDYRSKIVHGEDSNLSGKLQVLKNIASVTGFLHETSKRLLRLSLTEPVFMTDLKEC